MTEKTCFCNRTFVNECHGASQKIRNCRISLSARQRKKPHQLIQTYIIIPLGICTSSIVLCRKPFSIFAAATSAFPAARPARRHHVSVHRSALPPCIPESRKGLVNNGAMSRHDCCGAVRGAQACRRRKLQNIHSGFTNHRRKWGEKVLTPNFSQRVFCFKVCEVFS
jgi:hypothetical protein